MVTPVDWETACGNTGSLPGGSVVQSGVNTVGCSTVKLNSLLQSESFLSSYTPLITKVIRLATLFPSQGIDAYIIRYSAILRVKATCNNDRRAGFAPYPVTRDRAVKIDQIVRRIFLCTFMVAGTILHILQY